MKNHDLHITITYSNYYGPTRPEWYYISAVYDTKAERDAALAQHPKSMQLKTTEVTCHSTGATKFCINGMGRLKPAKDNALNETAQRRIVHFLNTMTYTSNDDANAYATADEARIACL